MGDLATAVRVAILLVGFTLFVWLLISVIRRAKRGGPGVRAAGAMLMLFGWGHMRDPRNDTVAEAQEGRVRRGAESGDPPN